MVRVNLHLCTELGDPGWEAEQPHPAAILFFGEPAKQTKRQEEEISALQLTEPSLLPAGANREPGREHSLNPVALIRGTSLPANTGTLLGLVSKAWLAARDLGFGGMILRTKTTLVFRTHLQT